MLNDGMNLLQKMDADRMRMYGFEKRSTGWNMLTRPFCVRGNQGVAFDGFARDRKSSRQFVIDVMNDDVSLCLNVADRRT